MGIIGQIITEKKSYYQNMVINQSKYTKQQNSVLLVCDDIHTLLLIQWAYDNSKAKATQSSSCQTY